MAWGLILVNLHLQATVFIGHTVDILMKDFKLPIHPPGLNRFPYTNHENAQDHAENFQPPAQSLHVRFVFHKCSKTLSLALRARGLSCISASVATMTFRLTN